MLGTAKMKKLGTLSSLEELDESKKMGTCHSNLTTRKLNQVKNQPLSLDP